MISDVTTTFYVIFCSAHPPLHQFLFTIVAVCYPGWCVPLSRVNAEAVPMHVTPRVGQVSWCCTAPDDGACGLYAALPSSEMNSLAPLVGGPNWLTRDAGSVGIMGGKRGRREYWVTLCLHHLYCPAYSQCFFRHLTQTCRVTGCPATRHTLRCPPMLDLVACMYRA